MLLNSLQCTRHPPTTNNYLAPSVNRSELETLSKGSGEGLISMVLEVAQIINVVLPIGVRLQVQQGQELRWYYWPTSSTLYSA